MTQALWILLAVMLAVAFYVTAAFFSSLRLRGKRLVSCPENQRPAGVQFGRNQSTLASCTRWPEKQGCGQECIQQIRQAPDGCLVRSLMERWYAGKTCAICGEAVDHREWLEHGPALIDRQRNTVDWDNVAVDQLPAVLEESLAVCFRCHTVELFRQTHSDLVTDRSRTAAR